MDGYTGSGSERGWSALGIQPCGIIGTENNQGHGSKRHHSDEERRKGRGESRARGRVCRAHAPRVRRRMRQSSRRSCGSEGGRTGRGTRGRGLPSLPAAGVQGLC